MVRGSLGSVWKEDALLSAYFELYLNFNNLGIEKKDVTYVFRNVVKFIRFTSFKVLPLAIVN